MLLSFLSFFSALGFVALIVGLVIGGEKEKGKNWRILFYIIYFLIAASFFFSKSIFDSIQPYLYGAFVNELLLYFLAFIYIFSTQKKLVSTINEKTTKPYQIFVNFFSIFFLFFSFLFQYEITKNIFISILFVIPILTEIWRRNSNKSEKKSSSNSESDSNKIFTVIFTKAFSSATIFTGVTFLSIGLSATESIKNGIGSHNLGSEFLVFFTMIFFAAKIILSFKEPISTSQAKWKPIVIRL